MATRIHQRNVVNAISIENTVIGEYLDGDEGDQFRRFKGDPQPATFPTGTDIPDDTVGDGHAYPNESRRGYFDPINKPYSGPLTTTIGARIFRMWLGGAITPTVNTTPGTIDAAIAQLPPGSEPMVCNQIRTNTQGGAKFLYGDIFVQTIEISQSGSGEPRISAQFSNGGHHEELPDTAIDVADIEAAASYFRYDGKRTRLTFSDGVDTYNFFSEKRQIDVTFTGNQNVDIEPMPGDGPLDAANECEGGFTQNLNINLQDASIRVKAYMNDTFHAKEFNAWKKKRKLTSVTLIFSTCEIIGATTHHAELEIKFPIGEFTLDPDSNNDKDAETFNIRAIKGDPTTGNLVVGRVRQVGTLDEVAP